MRRSDGPTASLLSFAGSQPGGVVTLAEARDACDHRPSVAMVLKRYFVRVEGARGLYVLASTIANDDWEDDLRRMRDFHHLFGCDEFGMSTDPSAADPGTGTGTRRFSRMSEV